MKDYIAKIRQKIGSDLFIHPAARILIENDNQQFLFVKKVDEGKLYIPAGALEENETIEQCIIREVKEETGLDILQLEVIGISSSPHKEKVNYPNGDAIQYFTIEFYSNSWSGELQVHDTTEIVAAAFLDKHNVKDIPDNERSIVESLDYYKREGKIRLS